MSFLDQASNIYGPLQPDVRAKLAAFFEAPSAETWDEVYCIVINPKSLRRSTVWQAVNAIDPKFPRGCAPFASPALKWERIPDPITVARAIKEATLP